MSRCPDCPVDAGRACRGEMLPHQCGSPRYRAHFARLAGMVVDVPPRPRGRGAGDAAHLRCPHARPLTRARNCRDAICSVSGLIVCRHSDCLACPIPAGRRMIVQASPASPDA